MSTGWSEGARGGGCCFRRTISTIRGEERRSNSFIMITWLKCDSFTTKFRQCSCTHRRWAPGQDPRAGAAAGGAGVGAAGGPCRYLELAQLQPGGALAHDQHVLQVHRGLDVLATHAPGEEP